MPRWPDGIKPDFPDDSRLNMSDRPRLSLEDQIAIRRHAEVVKSNTSILMMLVGGILGSVGIGFIAGVAAGVATLGGLIFIVGLIIGMTT